MPQALFARLPCKLCTQHGLACGHARTHGSSLLTMRLSRQAPRDLPRCVCVVCAREERERALARLTQLLEHGPRFQYLLKAMSSYTSKYALQCSERIRTGTEREKERQAARQTRRQREREREREVLRERAGEETENIWRTRILAPNSSATVSSRECIHINPSTVSTKTPRAYSLSLSLSL